MKLQPLAEGFCYKVTRTGLAPWELNQTWAIDEAPPECFADAAPQVEEPAHITVKLVGGRIQISIEPAEKP